jgi:T4 superinfection immunity protein/putative oligomerization/nucleic acid binding protein
MEEFGTTLIILILIFYFFPSIIAFSRSKSNTAAIVMLNLFLGWSFIGWIIALIWAVSKDRETQQIIVNNNAYSEHRTVTPTVNQPIPERLYNDGTQKTLSSQGTVSNKQNSNSHQEKIENLQKLKQLLDDEILTQDEFDQQKKQILG